MSEKEVLEGSKAFLWESGGQEAVLCLHGFTGSPGIFRKLGRVLLEDGLTVYSPRLPGHGTTPEELTNVTGDQLLSAAREAYAQLADSCERIHLIGLSLGGTLATLLGAEYAEDSCLGCVSLLSPGYSLNKTLLARLGLGTGIDLTAYGERMIPIPFRKSHDDEMDECIFGYNAVSLKAFAQLQSLNADAKAARAGLKAPVLLQYTRADTVVDADICAESAGIFSQMEEVRCFRESEHNLLLGCDREEVMSRCAAFIRRHRCESRKEGE